MEVIKKRYLTFIKALSTLEKSLDKLKSGNYSDYEELRDSIIQRFEYCCDIYWKFLKDLLMYRFKVKVEMARPKSVFRESRATKIGCSHGSTDSPRTGLGQCGLTKAEPKPNRKIYFLVYSIEIRINENFMRYV